MQKLEYVSYTKSFQQVYQKKKAVDADIKDLLRIMRNSLKFVEDMSESELKKMLSHSQGIVEELLGVIHKSSQFIRDNLHVTAIGKCEAIQVESCSM